MKMHWAVLQDMQRRVIFSNKNAIAHGQQSQRGKIKSKVIVAFCCFAEIT